MASKWSPKTSILATPGPQKRQKCAKGALLKTHKKNTFKKTPQSAKTARKRANFETKSRPFLALFSGPETRRLPNGPREPLFRILLIFGVPPGGQMTPKSMKKRPILPPKICKKRPAFRLVFQWFWVGKPEAQYQKRASIPSFFWVSLFGVQCNAIHHNAIQYNTVHYDASTQKTAAKPNAGKSAMSCSVPGIRYPPAIAMTLSRGGRSEAQQMRRGRALSLP